MARRTKHLALSVVLTDSTFRRVEARGTTLWEGKCLHCKRKLAVGLDGELQGEATIEHIVPRTHGGGNAPENLAIACARCNRSKAKLDARPFDDVGLVAVIQTLKGRRKERWRNRDKART